MLMVSVQNQHGEHILYRDKHIRVGRPISLFSCSNGFHDTSINRVINTYLGNAWFLKRRISKWPLH